MTRKPGAKIAKKDFIDEIDYVWITFTNNDVPQQILSLFRKEDMSKKVIKCLCCRENKVRNMTSFQTQELDVNKANEPDQIIWENLPFSATQ